MAQQDMHDDPQQLELLRVARIGRAQGLKGEVTVRLYTCLLYTSPSPRDRG